MGHAFAEEVSFDLVHQPFASSRICHGKTVFVNDHGLKMLPLFPSFFGNIVVNLHAQGAGKRRVVQAFGFAAEFYAVTMCAIGVLLIIYLKIVFQVYKHWTPLT